MCYLFLDGSDSSEGNVFFETDLATLDEKEEVCIFCFDICI